MHGYLDTESKTTDYPEGRNIIQFLVSSQNIALFCTRLDVMNS